MPGAGFQDRVISEGSAAAVHQPEQPKRLIGRETVDCMRSGMVYGNAAIIDGLTARIADELGEPVTAAVTAVCLSSSCPPVGGRRCMTPICC